jgi:hypothetical protein
MAFASQMKQVEGVRGVATYVATNTVKIYYDPEILNDVKIQAKLLMPMKTALHIMGKENKEVKVASMLVDKFFDPMDFTYLSILLREKTDALGVESEFECPVRVRIFFPANSTLTEEELIAKIESKSLTVLSAGKSKTIDLQYKVVNKIEYSTISAKAYVEKMFQPYQKDFNSKSDYKESVLDTLKVPLGENKYNTKTLPYLISHLSNDNGVIEFKSVLDSSLQIAFEIVYVDSITNKAKIEQALKSDSLSVTYSDGEAGKIVNMYKF